MLNFEKEKNKTKNYLNKTFRKWKLKLLNKMK